MIPPPHTIKVPHICSRCKSECDGGGLVNVFGKQVLICHQCLTAEHEAAIAEKKADDAKR